MELNREQAIEEIRKGHMITIVAGENVYTACDYIITGTDNIQWITLVHNQFIPDMLVTAYRTW